MDSSFILQHNVILAPYTTYHIGGPADYFYIAQDIDGLVRAVRWARERGVPYFLLGCGANILISDKGFRGLVIVNRAQDVFWEPNFNVRAESGAMMEDLVLRTQQKGWSGFEHFAGIPSTVGGALWQNLHFLAPDRAQTVFISTLLEGATLLDEKNELRHVEKDFFQFGYDQSVLRKKPFIVLDAVFRLEPKDPALIQRQIEANLAWRAAKHPSLEKFPSCGSVFKKIEDVGAGRLIEKAGLKGARIGDAQISFQHANFIVNLGQAQSRDVLALIDLTRKTVKERFGHDLELEINLVGEY